MDKEALKKKWQQLQEEAFERFLKEDLGAVSESEPPVCYKSGNGDPWCSVCTFHPTC